MPLPEGFSDLTPSQQLEYAGRKMARAAGVDPELVSSIGNLESGWNPAVRDGTSGEIGPLQIMPATAQGLGVDPDTLRDPVTNLQTGITLLSQLSAKYQGDPAKIAAAYNGGEGAVDAGAIPEHSQWYARTVLAAMPAATEAPPTPSASRMPLMSDAQSPVESRVQAQMPRMTDALSPAVTRGPPGGVDIPEGTALATSLANQERDQQPWYGGPHDLPLAVERMIDPLAELGIQGYRTLTGSTLPPVPVDRLALDAAQTAGLVGPALPLGRVASGLWQGGAGAAAALQTGAERHGTTGQSWIDQLHALDPTDAWNLGTQVAIGVAGGSLFPGTSTRPLSAEGGIAQARADLGTMMARDTADRALDAPRKGEVTAAFGQLDRPAQIDATGWKNAVEAHALEGKSVPGEVQAVVNGLVPEMKTKVTPVVLPPETVHGIAPLPAQTAPQVTQEMTGRWFGTVGDLLDANRALGAMVNLPAARGGEVLGHSVGNLTALRGVLSDELAAALPQAQRDLYIAARGTAKDVAQDTAGMRRIERYVNPDEGLLNGTGLYTDLTNNAEQRIKQFGLDRYQQLTDFARSVRSIMSTPERAAPVVRALKMALPFATTAGGYYAHGGVGAAAALAPQVLYGLATTETSREIFGALARTPLHSGAFLTALGRLTAARQFLGRQLVQDATPRLGASLPIDQPSPRATPPPIDQPGAASPMAGH